MLKDIMSNPYMWAIITAFGFFTGGLSIYAWISGKAIKEISVSCLSTVIIEKGKCSTPKLQIKYEGNNIDELTISNFYIWNSGNRVIKREDIATSDILAISNTGSSIILDAKVFKCNNSVNAVNILPPTDDTVKIDFEFLDPKDGMTIQVVHTGPSIDLELTGTIKDRGVLKDRSPYTRKSHQSRSDVILEILSVIIPIFGFISTYTIISNSVSGVVEIIGVEWLAKSIATLAIIIIPVLTMFLLFKIITIFNKKRGRIIPESLLK